MIPLADLKPLKKNPRRGDVDFVRESLRRFGQYVPIVVRRNTLEILKGNHTYLAAKEEGWTEIACVTRVIEDDEEAIKLSLSDNLATDRSSWDFPELADLLQSFDSIEGSGFEEPDFQQILSRAAGEDAAPGSSGDTSPPKKPKRPKTRPGDLIQLGDHRLLCGDATDSEDAKRLLGKDRSPLLFTSPPYADVRHYDGESNMSPEHLSEFLSVYRDRASIQAVNLGILRRENAIYPYWNAYLEAAEDAGLLLLSWNVWDRNQPWSMGQNSAMFPIEHEWVFVFGEKRRALNLTIANKTPGARTGVSNRQEDGSMRASPTKIVREKRALGTVFRSSPHIGADIGHPAMFPVALPEAYISAATVAGDLVVDPFAGSGTTAIAAENLGRRARMVEIDPGYCDVIVSRWEKHTGRKARRPRRTTTKKGKG